MSNEVAVPMSQDAALAAYLSGDVDPFDTYTKEAGVNDGNGYLKFSGNTGRWTVKDDDLGDGFAMAFDMLNAKRGWICWLNEKPVKKLMEPFLGGPKPPPESALEPITKVKESDGWRFAMTVKVYDLSGEHGELELTLPAEEGYRPINKLMKQFAQLAKKYPDKAAGTICTPVVECSAESFDSKGGKKFAPLLEIIDWLTVADMEQMRLSDADDEAEAPPAIAEDKAVEAAPAAAEDAKPSYRDGRRGRRK